MFHIVSCATLVDDDFVADCGYRFRTCLLAYFIEHVFGVGFGIAEHGNFDEFVKFKRKANVFDLVVTDTVFAYLKYRVYFLCK